MCVNILMETEPSAPPRWWWWRWCGTCCCALRSSRYERLAVVGSISGVPQNLPMTFFVVRICSALAKLLPSGRMCTNRALCHASPRCCAESTRLRPEPWWLHTSFSACVQLGLNRSRLRTVGSHASKMLRIKVKESVCASACFMHESHVAWAHQVCIYTCFLMCPCVCKCVCKCVCLPAIAGWLLWEHMGKHSNPLNAHKKTYMQVGKWLCVCVFLGYCVIL